MKSATWSIIILVSVLFFLVNGCSKDEDNPPVTGTISGTIHLQGTVPSNAKITLSLFSQSYDTGPPSKAIYLHPGDTLVSFELTDLSLGSYPYLLIGVKDTVLEQHYQFIGMYTAGASAADSALSHASAITLSEASPRLTGVSLYGDYAFYISPDTSHVGTITGTVDFRGNWPAQAVYVVIQATPTSMPSAMARISADTTTFRLTDVPFGTYQVVGAFTYPALVRLGQYGMDAGVGDTIPESVTVDAAHRTQAVNFVAYGDSAGVRIVPRTGTERRP